jgi:hypothetical protein
MPRHDDEDDVPSVAKRELSGLDGMFANTSMPILIIFAFCCSGIALILGIVGLIVCTDEKAKSNALVVTIIAAIVAVGGTGIRIMTSMGR